MPLRAAQTLALLLTVGWSSVGPEPPRADLCWSDATRATPPTAGQNVRVSEAGAPGAARLDLVRLDAATDDPEMAWRTQIEGAVTVRVEVDAAGEVVGAEVVVSPNELLSEAALVRARDTRAVGVGASPVAAVDVAFRLCGGA